MSKVVKTKSPRRTSERRVEIDLSLIIVNYNVKEFLEQCLISVQKALKGISAEILVIDNSSADGSAELLRQEFPDLRLTLNSRNVGFAKASNQGLQIARGKFIALLNPDTLVQEDTFSKMLDFFRDRPKIGMLGCKILNPDGSLQLACRRSFPKPWVAFTKLSGLSYLFPKSKLFGKYNLTYLDPDDSYEVDAISGSFMMIRREVLEDVGDLDESFFMYGEDLDWCFRTREKGWQVVYFPETQIVHFKGESSKRAHFDNLKQFYIAMELFVKKHFKQKYFFMPYWLLRGAIWFRAGISLFIKLTGYLAVPLIDIVLFGLSLILGVLIRFGNLTYLPPFIPVIIFYSLIWVLFLKLFGCYDREEFSFSKAAIAVLVGFLVNTSLTFFFKQYAFSRVVVLVGSVFSLIIVPGWRLLIKELSRTRFSLFGGRFSEAFFAKNTIIVGDLKSGEKLVEKFNSQIDSDYKISGLVSTNGRHTGKNVAGVPVLGTFEDINFIIREHGVQEVIFSTHDLSYDQILGVMSRTGKQRVNFNLIPSNLDVIIGKASIDRISHVPLLEIDYKLHQTPYRVLKRMFDFTLAFVILTLSLPLFLYKKFLTSQKIEKKFVYGEKNQRVLLYQFAGSESQTSNKLPYLWAILKGDVSFVGKELIEVSDDFSPTEEKPDLKPGLTGLQQINQHKHITEEDKSRYPLYYIKNYSLFLDMEILFKAFFQKRNRHD
ncbi:MAG: glycosyltransferase [Caldithrix sp.]|nr:MAG: glycosyltransferase [Caldithrix sp.]